MSSIDIDGRKAVVVRGADAETVGGAPITTWLLAEGDPTGGSVSAIRSKLEYFRLADRIRRGQASPAEILARQEVFDNHFVDSPVWAEELR